MILILIVSGSAFLISILAELQFGMIPCSLCLTQRFLHLSLFVFSALFLVLRKRLFIFFSLILLGASFMIAAYHTLIQLDLIKGQCQTALRIMDLASYKAALLAASPCKESWKLWSIPISALNAALSGALFILTLFKRKSL